MKKIMFNDRFGLTQAVLDGRKTMTRRIMKVPKKFMGEEDLTLEYHQRLTENKHFYDCVVCDADGYELGQMPLPYEVGEVVAIAQRYKDCWDYYQKQWEARNDSSDWHTPDAILGDTVQETKGWTNKMFVNPNLMPWKIAIDNLWFERLQDISEEDCMREGIFKYDKPPLHHEMDRFAPWLPYVKPYKFDLDNLQYRATARDAFAALIDRVNGRGTWERNPWVVAYSFELIK